MRHYTDYCWKKGVPLGIGPCEPGEISYRIISDPYKKRISIEKYTRGSLDRVIYDSYLLDFRHLNPADQMAWRKIQLGNTEKEVRCLIHNQDDRAIVYETHYFEGERCKECHIYSVHGIFIGVQKMSYTALGDPFDGVALFDSNGHQVLLKHYKTDQETGQFTELIEEK
jgi:hypothetical protein